MSVNMKLFIATQVGLPEDVEARSFVPDISGVTIKDEAASDDGDSNPSSGTLWKYKLLSNSISKEAAVGSLSFNVIDTSPRKQSAELPKQVAFEDGGKLASSSQQQKIAVRKPAPRAKVPFEKGYSQMDWLKLCRTHPDLAGTNNLECFIVELLYHGSLSLPSTGLTRMRRLFEKRTQPLCFHSAM